MKFSTAFAFVTMVSASLATIGCDRSGDPGSCYRADLNTCLQYTKAQGGTGKKICSDAKWTAGESSCPKENLLGSCARDNGEVTEYNYAGPPMNFTADGSKQTCATANGKWATP